MSIARIGKRHTEESIEKMKENIGQGSKNKNWRGGSRVYFRTIARAVFYENNTNVICEHCGITENICIHHKDENIENNNLNNLQPLCRSCHARHHIKKINPIRFRYYGKKV